MDTDLNLRNYERLKLDLAGHLRAAMHLARESKADASVLRIQDLLARVAEDRFTLAVVGQFNRGKSSLMNAIIGSDRLPVGVLPSTTAITKVIYGEPERAWIEFEGSRLRTKIAIDAIGEYVSEAGNPGNRKHVVSAEVQLPSDVLRYGYFFVDTPGIGSANEINTLTTERFLPQADAVLFVTSFESPLNETEIGFLRRVASQVRQIYVVINKRDLVTGEEDLAVTAFVQRTIDQQIGHPASGIFSVSARDGLRAKLSGSVDQLEPSGIPQLERVMVRFLIEKKGRALLISVAGRAIDALQLLTTTSPKTEEQRRQLLLALKEFVQTAESSTPLSPNDAVVDTVPSANARQSCKVCVQMLDAVFRFMTSFQYEITHDEKVRSAHEQRGGFCPIHTWQYAEVASPQGVCQAYPGVLRHFSELIKTAGEKGLNGTPQGANCQACEIVSECEVSAVAAIAKAFSSQSSLPALCIKHCAEVVSKCPDPKLRQRLVLSEAESLERIAENMERYALKHEAIRRVLATEEELVADRAGLTRLVGHPKLATPWKSAA